MLRIYKITYRFFGAVYLQQEIICDIQTIK